jgi:predicted nucleotidyltransferase
MKNLEDLKLRNNEREATRMLKEEFPVKGITLFGSKARGDSDEESDIDLFLVTKQPCIGPQERFPRSHALRGNVQRTLRAHPSFFPRFCL